MKVIKRDGSKVYFDIQKIITALTKAMISVDGCLYDTDLAEEIASEIAELNKDLTVEQIQDIVEHKLIESERSDVAEAYALFREKRQKQRAKNSALIKQVLKRINATSVENSNANVDVQKLIAFDYTPSEDVAQAHKDMLLYQHYAEKTNVGAHNCLFVDFKKIFTEGFTTRNGDIRPPTSYSTACQQLAVVFQCQSQVQFGGVGTIHLDYDLAPFVKKSFKKHIKNYFTDVEDIEETSAEKLMRSIESDCGEICIDNEKLKENYEKAYSYAIKQLEREGRQASEALYHNLNSLESRAGSQVPFTSINLGRDISTEGKLVQKWIMNASLSGIGKHHLTPIFPISIY